jgi:hypothetical protein
MTLSRQQAARIVAHIGANKAASTTLQNHLFATHPSIHYVGEGSRNYDRYRPILLNFLGADDIFWNRTTAEIFFREELSAAKDKTFVFSSEDIMTSPTASLCAQRLRSLLGPADILLIIRDQLSAICSYYASHGAYLRPAPMPHYKRHVPLVNWLEYNFDVLQYGPITGFDYWSIAEHFAVLFGSDRIKILVYEEISAQPDRFCSDLALLLGISPSDVRETINSVRERRRVSERRFYYDRIRSYLGVGARRGNSAVDGGLSRHLTKLLDGGAAMTPKIPDEWRARIIERYAKGNARLAQKYGLPLNQYGYPL